MTTTTTPAALPTRPSYVTAHLRPIDLTPGDVILVERDWREVADVWHDRTDLDDIANTLGEDSGKLARIRDYLTADDQYVIVRYWVEQARGEGVTDGLRTYRRPELVATQVLAGQVPYPDLAMYRTNPAEQED